MLWSTLNMLSIKRKKYSQLVLSCWRTGRPLLCNKLQCRSQLTWTYKELFTKCKGWKHEDVDCLRGRIVDCYLFLYQWYVGFLLRTRWWTLRGSWELWARMNLSLELVVAKLGSLACENGHYFNAKYRGCNVFTCTVSSSMLAR